MASAVLTDLLPLEFRGVSKRFDTGTLALDHVSLRVERGELAVIVGPSGCGKSTLLALAAGLTRPTGGSVQLGAERLGYVFQEPTLMPWRSVRKNVEIGNELARMGRAERNARAREAIAVVGLQGFEDQLPGHLSGGMKMRVSLARAIAVRPELFLFDEPFGALDEITRLQMQEELQRIVVSLGVTGMFITHSVSEAVFLASTVHVMTPRPGRISASVRVPFAHPRPAELRYTPEFNEIVADVSARLLGAHQ